MQNKLFLLALIVVGCLSFLTGKYSSQQEKTNEYLDALVTTVNLSSDRWNDIQLLTVLYEASLQNQDTVRYQYILAVSLMYRDDVRLKDLFNNDLGLSTGTYSTNNAVVEALKLHGYEECANLSSGELVQCNLDVLENDA